MYGCTFPDAAAARMGVMAKTMNALKIPPIQMKTSIQKQILINPSLAAVAINGENQMNISTGKGDKGFTRTLRGDYVPKHHLIVEVGGAIDEASAQLGLARSMTKVKRTRRIALHIQQHLFIVGAEVSAQKGAASNQKKKISKLELQWVERLVEQFEEAMALPPGFIAFGQQEASSQFDVARTNIRKAERLASKMKDEGMLDNEYLLKYMNRLSDLVFLLACYDEKSLSEKAAVDRTMLYVKLSDPIIKRLTIVGSAVIFILAIVIVSLLMFHGNPKDKSGTQHNNSMMQHMNEYKQNDK